MKTLNTYINEWRYNKDDKRSIVKITPKNFYELTSLINKEYERNPGYLDLRHIDVSLIKDFNKKNPYANNHVRDKRGHGYESFGLFAMLDDIEIIDVTGWKFNSANELSNMFFMCTSLQEIKGIENWDVSNIKHISYMFYNCKNLRNIDLSNWNIKNIEDMNDTFFQCSSTIIPHWYRNTND